jgi:alpha-tubulin suppressor-like RCC1 family protein
LKILKIDPKKIKKTSFGWGHVLILIEENGKNNLFGFGCNDKGQLGINDGSTSKLSNVNFFNDKNILDFMSGYSSSYVLIGLKKNHLFIHFFNFLIFR